MVYNRSIYVQFISHRRCRYYAKDCKQQSYADMPETANQPLMGDEGSRYSVAASLEKLRSRPWVRYAVIGILAALAIGIVTLFSFKFHHLKKVAPIQVNNKNLGRTVPGEGLHFTVGRPHV